MHSNLPPPERHWALFTDVDGTLLDMAAAPDAVTVPPRLLTTLPALSAALDGALALVSGRSIATLDRLFHPLRLPTAGQHGAELRLHAPDATTTAAAHPMLRQLAGRLVVFAETRPGLLIEDKGNSIAVHYRADPRWRDELQHFLLTALAEADGGLELLPAKLAFDVKPSVVSKGTAVAAFMRQQPFAERLPVFIGDDRTDEDGFAAAQALGGLAIRVGNGPTNDTLWSVETPKALRTWLATIAGELNSSPTTKDAT